ncbi:MAG: ECF transporter S component [Candidatus Thermoplasmatota archaeon]
MKKTTIVTSVFVCCVVAVFVLWFLVLRNFWLVGGGIVLFGIFGGMILQFETGFFSSKEVSVIAVLCGVSAVSRVPFAGIPSVQPCTFLILCTGYVFGPVAGFMTGAMTAVLSNMFLGHGPWTVFQMIGWGLVGWSAGFLPKLGVKIKGLMVAGFLWGYGYGVILNLWYWTLYVYPHTVTSFLFSTGMSFWFDTLHAVGNVLFFLLLGDKVLMVLDRYKKRFSFHFFSSSKEVSSG